MEQYTGHLKKGDVVYAPFPLDNLVEPRKKSSNTEQADTEQGDPREQKDRPVLILWKADANSFTVCGITKNPFREHKIELNGRDLDSGKIDYEPSFIRPNIVTTLPRKYIRRKVGTLKLEKLKEVLDKVKEFLDADPEEAPVPKAFERAKRRIR